MSCAAGAALAQSPTPPSALSDQQKAAIGVILDSLTTTKAGEDLTNRVVREIDRFSNDPKGAESVVIAVNMGAGQNLRVFQDILVNKCISGGGVYCQLAALPAPQTQSSNVQTSATGGGGAAGGGGAGGGPQTSYGHNTQNNGVSGNRLPITSAPQQFSFSLRSFGSTSGLFSAAAQRPTIATPGPQAGAGLISALLTAASLFLAGRRSRKAKRDRRRRAFIPRLFWRDRES